MLTIDLGTGLDYNPVSSHLSDWLRSIHCGDYDKFLGFLDGLSEEEVKRLLSKRESLLNISAVFHVIEGATVWNSVHPKLQDYQNYLRQNLDVKDGHMKILVKLLSLGVDVNARDIGGQTPLHICSSSLLGLNEVVFKMSQSWG